MRWIIFSLCLIVFLGCSTTEEESQAPSNRPKSRTLPQYDYDNMSNADGYSFYGDGMMIRTPMPNSAGSPLQPQRFFFKDCLQSQQQKFYHSKTSYDCTYP